MTNQPKQAGEAIERCVNFVIEEAPRPGHAGPCGPESGCDGDCMDAYHASQMIRDAKADLQAFRELLEAARDVLPDRHVEQIHIERLRMVVARFDAKDGKE